MQRNTLKNLLLNLCAILLISCSSRPTYSRQDIADVIKRICKDEYKIEVGAWSVGDTVWVYTPFKFFDESGKLLITNGGPLPEELSKLSRNIVGSITRAFLNMDKPPRFCCLVRSDTEQYGMDLYEIAFVPDQMQFLLASYATEQFLSSQEIDERVVKFQFFTPEAMRDEEGIHIQKYDLSVEEFVVLSIQQKLLQEFAAENAQDNYLINDLTVDYAEATLKISFDIRIKKYKEGLIIPFEKAEEITKKVLDIYGRFSAITGAEIVDQFKNQTKRLSFTTYREKMPALEEIENINTLSKLQKVTFYLINANAFNQKNDFKKEKEMLEKALLLLPNDVMILDSLADFYNKSGEPQKAIPFSRKSLEIYPKGFVAQYNLGRSYLLMGKIEEALVQFENVLALKPGSPQILAILALTHKSLGNDKKALYLVEKALSKNPKDPETYCTIGDIYRELGSYEKALEVYQKGLALDKNYVRLYLSLGKTYTRMGNSKEALASYEKALALAPDALDVNYELGQIYITLGQYEKSVEFYKKAINLMPGYSELYTGLGTAYDRLGTVSKNPELHTEAIKQFEHSLKLNPNDPQAYCQLGEAYNNLGQYDKALSQFQKALSFDPEYAAAYHGLGNTYYALGQREKAIQNFEKSKALFEKQGNHETAQQIEEYLRFIR